MFDQTLKNWDRTPKGLLFRLSRSKLRVFRILFPISTFLSDWEKSFMNHWLALTYVNILSPFLGGLRLLPQFYLQESRSGSGLGSDSDRVLSRTRVIDWEFLWRSYLVNSQTTTDSEYKLHLVCLHLFSGDRPPNWPWWTVGTYTTFTSWWQTSPLLCFTLLV